MGNVSQGAASGAECLGAAGWHHWLSEHKTGASGISGGGDWQRMSMWPAGGGEQDLGSVGRVVGVLDVSVADERGDGRREQVCGGQGP